MTTRERFWSVMNVEPFDRLPMIEWAVWWDKTIEHWHSEGLPASVHARYDLYRYFGLEMYRQDWISPTRPGCPQPPRHGAGLIATAADYEWMRPFLYPKPAVDAARWRHWVEKQRRGESVLWYTVEGFFWFPRRLLGIERHLYAFYDQPDFLHRINSDLAEWMLQVVGEIHAIGTPDFMTFAEDMSDNHGPMLSKELFDTFLKPYDRRVLPSIRADGTLAIVDSDGGVTIPAGWFEEAGLDGILPLERQAGVDLVRLRREHSPDALHRAFRQDDHGQGRGGPAGGIRAATPCRRPRRIHSECGPPDAVGCFAGGLSGVPAPASRVCRTGRNTLTTETVPIWRGRFRAVAHGGGGTLGAPFEWRRQINAVRFYMQDLKGEPIPNDDLGIQLLWLIALEERGIHITAHTLAEYWCLHVTPHWSEYGTAKSNMRSGLLPPLCGTVNNAFMDSCGAFIRSEIWACITPGCPALAARYAYEDAILDHGNGEGTYAEVFSATLESAAFVVSDLRTLIEIGLSCIPDDCGVARAVRHAVSCHLRGLSWRKTRDEILRRYRGGVFFNRRDHIKAADARKGFATGRLGYDAPSNVALFVAALLYGGTDVGKTVCTAVNCGEDTDCPAATAGAIWGIGHGFHAIPERWIKPIGRSIKTIAVNVGNLHWQLPKTVDELTDRTARIAKQVLLHHRGTGMTLSDQPTDGRNLSLERFYAGEKMMGLYANRNGPRFGFDFFTIDVDYGETPIIRSGASRPVRFTIRNRYRTQSNLAVRWYVPEGWHVAPGPDAVALSLPSHLGPPVTLECLVQADRGCRPVNRCVVEFTAEGRPTVMLVPITLLNGNAQPVAGTAVRDGGWNTR